MVPFSRNPPWRPADVPPRDCVNCRVQANRLNASGSVALQRNGFTGYGASKKFYRQRTITATYTSHVTGTHPDEYTDRDGAITLVYQMTLSGETRLVSASGSWDYEDLDRVPIFDPEDPETIIGYEETLTQLSSSIVYNPAGGGGLGAYSWSGTANATLPGNFGSIPVTPPTDVSEAGDQREWTVTVSGGTWITTELLEDEYTDTMLENNAKSLLDAISLGALELDGTSLTAFYGGVGPYRSTASFDADIAAAEANVTAVEINLAGVTLERSIAESALSAAEAAVASARDELEAAWITAMEKRSDLEAVLVRIERWTHLENEAELSSAQGDLPAAESAWEAAWAAWEGKEHALDVALDAVRTSRAMTAQADFFVLISERALQNAEYFVSLAASNKAKALGWDQIMVIPGGTGSEPSRARTFDEDDILESIELSKQLFQFYWQAPSSWSKNPASVAVGWHRVFVGDDSSIEAGGLVTDEVGLSEDARVALGSVHEMAVPTDDGTAYVAGLSSRGTLAWFGEKRGGAARKMGFLAYDGTKTYFLRETAGGGFPGCPAQDLPALSYSGSQSYTPSPAELDNWQSPPHPGPVEENFSADVPSHRRSIVPSPVPYRGGEGIRAHLEFLDPGEVLSATQRRWVSTVKCGDNTLQDVQTLTLSQEFTLAALRELVDPVYEQPWGVLPALVAPEAFDSSPVVAVNWTSEGQDYYAKVQVRGKFVFSMPPGSASIFPIPSSLSMQWKRVTTDMETGEQTELIVDQSLAAGESEVIVLEAPEGKKVEIVSPTLTSDDPRMWDIPYWRPVCEDN